MNFCMRSPLNFNLCTFHKCVSVVYALHFSLLTGFHIKYCALSEAGDSSDRGHDLQSVSFAIQTVLNPEARSHILDGLEENTRYLVFMHPFFQSDEGPASNSIYVQTLEDRKYSLNLMFSIKFDLSQFIQVKLMITFCFLWKRSFINN